MIVQTGDYLVMTLPHGHPVAKSKIRGSESFSTLRPPCTVSVRNELYAPSALHLCPFKLEAQPPPPSCFFLPPLAPFLLALRARHIQPYRSKFQLASILEFNFLPEPWQYLKAFYLHYLQLSTSGKVK